MGASARRLIAGAILIWAGLMWAGLGAPAAAGDRNAGYYYPEPTTREVYGAWVDMDELKREDDEVAGQDVADEGMAYLSDINRNRKKIGRNLRSRV